VTAPRALCAYGVYPGGRWDVCWVIMEENLRLPALAAGQAPRLVQADTLGLHLAIEGLCHEAGGENEPAALELWAALMHRQVQRILQPGDADPRLRRLWLTIRQDLGGGWNLARMARCAGLSPESLRRLCQQQAGRPPLAQLTHLRMLFAADLLTCTREKISAVAARVGYEDAFAFSNAFKREMGVPPSLYRHRPPPRPDRRECQIADRVHAAQLRPMPYLLIVSFIWAFSFGLIKGRLAGLDSAFISAVRLGPGAAGLSALPPPARAPAAHAAGARRHRCGAVRAHVSRLQRKFPPPAGPRSRALHAHHPLFVTLLADALDRRFRRRALAAALLAVGGTGLIVFQGQELRPTLIGLALVQLSNLAFALGQVGYKRLRAKAARAPRPRHLRAALRRGLRPHVLPLALAHVDFATFTLTPSQSAHACSTSG
jgi:AraC-like DNA-binding protein